MIPSPRIASLSVVSLAALMMGPAGCRRSGEGLPGDDVVVARVNGTPITSYDLSRGLDQNLGRFATPAIEGRAQKAVLESLIQSRVIAGAGESALTPLEKLELAKQVEAYRESLLVRSYLAKKAPVEPITPALIERYYKEHPERFGASETKTYELLGTKRAVVGQERAAVMQALQEAGGLADWKAKSVELEARGLPLVYAVGDVSGQLVHPRLRELLDGLTEGKASPVVFVQERAYVARITGSRKIPPKPLAEVSEEIRRALTPVQLRNAAEKAAAQLMDGAKIERFALPAGPSAPAPSSSPPEEAAHAE
jgi:hypothetical protein